MGGGGGAGGLGRGRIQKLFTDSRLGGGGG